ncbi:hypothetical protein O181_082735 [Austropuccinia psidii MF-1]|uniref:Integrase catalytic domain-containing protein n=1 Tax=Austropuccinia psidii MF-1 TaxID=1389203 RepID=A0A9Q3FSG2_9BASI|nr:hypothetical protein [Austropuccinia psidii MF-1]
MIHNLEDIITRFCAYGMEFKDSDDFTHDWCTLIPALELAYTTSIHASTGKTPAMLEKGWNPKITIDTLKKDLVDIHPTSSIFKFFLDKVRHNADQSMNYSFEYAKQKWDKKPFSIEALHGTNLVQVEISGELENKHPTFPVSLVKNYISSDIELFPLRNEKTLEVPPLDQSEEKKVLKVLKERKIRGKNEREYLVRYRNP